jgi:hypothetical protein
MAKILDLHYDEFGGSLSLTERYDPDSESSYYSIRAREGDEEGAVVFDTLDELIIMRNALDDFLHERI